MKWCFRGLLQSFACCLGRMLSAQKPLHLFNGDKLCIGYSKSSIKCHSPMETGGTLWAGIFAFWCFMYYSFSCLCFRHFFQLPTCPSLKHFPGCSASPLGLPSPFPILKMKWVLHPPFSTVHPPFLYLLYFSFSLHYVHCYVSPRNHWVLIICVCIKVNL